MKRRVVVTGLGAIAPNGNDAESFWAACREGRPGVKRIERFDTTGFPVHAAGEVRGFNAREFVPKPKALKIMGQNIRLGVAASQMAMEHSGLKETPPDGDRFGVVMGAGIVPTDVEEIGAAIMHSLDDDGNFSVRRFGEKGKDMLFPLWLLKHLPNMVAAHISIIHGARGPNNTIVTACSAATQAMGEAARIIERGDADVLLTGGADSRIDPLSLIAYTRLGALAELDLPPERMSRPFSRDRAGFVLGEGAGVLVFESEEHAKARGATIHAEVAGYGSTFDAVGVTMPDPEAISAAEAMRVAIADAGLEPGDIDYVSAHGTSTLLNDKMETLAAKKVFGADAARIPMSSIKSMIGHLIGAAGAMEAIVSVLAIRDNVVPPTINLDVPDPECDLDYVPHTAREMKVSTVLSNSFGFGGQNAALVLREYRG